MDILAYCEAAGMEEIISSDEFDERLHKDVEMIVQKAFEKMSRFPIGVRTEVQASLRAFAEDEITIALDANSKKVMVLLSRQLDTAFQTLIRECQVIEKAKFPMKNTLLQQECTELLNRELAHIKALPLSLQGMRGVEIECDRVRQTASLIFDKLEVANDKAIQQSTAALSDVVRAAKARMSSELHDNLDKRFAEQHPVTVTKLQADVDILYAKAMREVMQQAKNVRACGASDLLVVEKKEALMIIEKERLMRERLAAEEKEAEIRRLKVTTASGLMKGRTSHNGFVRSCKPRSAKPVNFSSVWKT